MAVGGAGGRGAVVVIGNFDGVHRGHQAVLEDAVRRARAEGLVATVLTFDPHPAGVLGRGAPPLLTSIPHRAALLVSLGVERVAVRRFDRAFAASTPQAFADGLLRDELGARHVVVGENFRFGAGRAGDLTELRRLGERLGFDAVVHAMSADGAGAYSSTRVREAVAAGDMEGAGQLLGRPHSFAGIVVHGDARGRTLGFPTANLDEVEEMVPPRGVYVVRVDRQDKEGPGAAPRPLGGGVMNCGVRPTVSGVAAERREVHLLEAGGDLYGARLRVHLLARLREERAFPTLDALKTQIHDDVARARAILGLAAGGDR